MTEAAVAESVAPKTRLEVISLDQIDPNEIALRTVNKDSEKYLELVESIRKMGVMNSITVREYQTQDGFTRYSLTDGLQRFSASRDAGRSSIPCNIVAMDDAEVLIAQIVANVHKIETRPVDYAKQLIRIVSNDPLMTQKGLASLVSKSETWVDNMLGLTKLDPKVAELVNKGEIKLSNAYALAKLPQEEQKDFVDRAITDPPNEFLPVVHERVKEVKAARAEGRKAEKAEFKATPSLRNVKEIKGEFESSALAETLCQGLSTAQEGFARAMEWVLKMDPESQKKQLERYQQREKEREEAKKRREKERAEAKEKAAAEKAASLESF